MNVFERYAPFIQDYIYRSGWRSLRAVQNAAGEAIFGSEQNVLLTASTASGKTEAAFFPILTLLEEEPSRSVGVLYIAPLKALINDQFGRLEELCQEAGIPVTRWHGDASQSGKRKLLKKPAGILQITPESLESLLINKHMEIPSLFGDLRFIVIDEIHSLLRGDRGLQTFCLIQRLCRLAGCDPRRVGLSATIGDPEAAGRFLAAGSSRGTQIPRFDGGRERWRLSMEHFFLTDPQAGDGGGSGIRDQGSGIKDQGSGDGGGSEFRVQGSATPIGDGFPVPPFPACRDGSQPSASSGEAAGDAPARSGEHCSPWADEAAGNRQQATGNRQQATDKPPLPRGGGPTSRPVEGWPRGQSPSDDPDKATGNGPARSGEHCSPYTPEAIGDGQQLVARRVSLEHPLTGERLCFVSKIELGVGQQQEQITNNKE